MRKALLLIDLQHDFLNRPGLLPAFSDLTGPIKKVLTHARASDISVAHVRTEVQASGTDRMPHWQKNDVWECVSGSVGAQAPEDFEALEGEPIFHKQFFSGFGNPGLDDWLRSKNIEELWIAGVYTHGCVRATVMDAYEKGYQVTVIEDCIGSNDPLHAQVTRAYLSGRAASFSSSDDLLNAIPLEAVHYNPGQPDEEVARVKHSSSLDIQTAIENVGLAGAKWCRQPVTYRRDIFCRFADKLQQAEQQLVHLLISNLGKPRRDAEDELQRAQGHLAAALELEDLDTIASGATVHYRPHGVVALITPWNNPLAIPVGKLVAAMLFGNSVVWKPAFQADNVSRLLRSLLQDSGLPDGLLQIVNGGPAQVGKLVAHSKVAAVSLTGPEQAGKSVAAICLPTGKPLQAELGGNNALLVMADADMEKQVGTWVRMAFGFAGQRCTAVRRFVLERAGQQRFENLFGCAVKDLQLDNPDTDGCDVGPLISAAQLQRVQRAVDSAVARGARLLAGGKSVATAAGHYYLPTLLADLSPEDPLVQEELFGPVAVVQAAEDFECGLALVNGVRQGLLAGIATTSPTLQDAFAQQVQAGIVIDGTGLKIHPAAPFGGCKASQIGPPEHGVWDRQFFSRVQMRYQGDTQ
jgi:acyl-CoA reductase-like NAD-dependent aldehyde dehydrogenase